MSLLGKALGAGIIIKCILLCIRLLIIPLVVTSVRPEIYSLWYLSLAISGLIVTVFTGISEEISLKLYKTILNNSSSRKIIVDDFYEALRMSIISSIIVLAISGLIISLAWLLPEVREVDSLRKACNFVPAILVVASIDILLNPYITLYNASKKQHYITYGSGLRILSENLILLMLLHVGTPAPVSFVASLAISALLYVSVLSSYSFLVYSNILCAKELSLVCAIRNSVDLGVGFLNHYIRVFSDSFSLSYVYFGDSMRSTFPSVLINYYFSPLETLVYTVALQLANVTSAFEGLISSSLAHFYYLDSFGPNASVSRLRNRYYTSLLIVSIVIMPSIALLYNNTAIAKILENLVGSRFRITNYTVVSYTTLFILPFIQVYSEIPNMVFINAYRGMRNVYIDFASKRLLYIVILCSSISIMLCTLSYFIKITSAGIVPIVILFSLFSSYAPFVSFNIQIYSHPLGLVSGVSAIMLGLLCCLRILW